MNFTGNLTSFFSMGLTERHLKKFHGSRIHTTIVFENVPQMFIQIWYFADRGFTDEIALLASISSFLSIFIALIDVWSSMVIVKVG